MKFRFPQAQEAYEEVLREGGKTIAWLENQGALLASLHRVDEVAILMRTAEQVATARMELVSESLRIGTEVDQRWASLAAHLAMEATHE